MWRTGIQAPCFLERGQAHTLLLSLHNPPALTCPAFHSLYTHTHTRTHTHKHTYTHTRTHTVSHRWLSHGGKLATSPAAKKLCTELLFIHFEQFNRAFPLSPSPPQQLLARWRVTLHTTCLCNAFSALYEGIPVCVCVCKYPSKLYLKRWMNGGIVRQVL